MINYNVNSEYYAAPNLLPGALTPSQYNAVSEKPELYNWYWKLTSYQWYKWVNIFGNRTINNPFRK